MRPPPPPEYYLQGPPLSPQILDVRQVKSCLKSPCETPARKFQQTQEHAVRFADEALLYCSDWTEEEIKQSWYNPEELVSFKQDRRDTVRELKRVNFCLDKVSEDDYCLRGYEAYFSVEMNRAVKISRDMVYTVVFAEQERQRYLQQGGCLNNDPAESIRVYSSQASQWARENALQLGANDATESFMINFPYEEEFDEGDSFDDVDEEYDEDFVPF